MTSATTFFFCAATSRCLSVETTYKPSKLSFILLKLPLDSARLSNVEQVVVQVIVDFPILFDIFIAIGDVWEIFAHTSCLLLCSCVRSLVRAPQKKERKKEVRWTKGEGYFLCRKRTRPYSLDPSPSLRCPAPTRAVQPMTPVQIHYYRQTIERVRVINPSVYPQAPWHLHPGQSQLQYIARCWPRWRMSVFIWRQSTASDSNSNSWWARSIC